MEIDTNPEYVEFAEVDGLWVRAYTLEKRHQIAAQHVHEHDHITLLASGSVAFWRNGEQVSEHKAPALLTVTAGAKHAFVALSDNVVLCCLHNLRGTGLESPQVLDEVT
jgi:quercetin dioxygenase-like cupin family protein